MKKKSLILMFAIAGLFSSCNDAIDIDQAGQVSNPAEIYKTADDIKRGVSGIYSLIPGETQIQFDSVFTDEVALGPANGGQGLISGEYGFFMQPGNSFVTSTWGSYYRLINQINRLINSTDILLNTAPSTQIASLRKSKAELLVIRAYSNYKLFSYFTPDYTNPSGLSIMKLDFLQTDDYSTVVGRSTVSEIKNFILDDLIQAEAVKIGGDSYGGNTFVNQGLIDGIRTKLYSLTGDYQNVLISAQKVLANPDNQISNATQFQDYFNDLAINKEIIFQLARVRGNAGVASSWYSTSVAPNGQPFYEMGRSLYNELDKLDPTKTGQSNRVGDTQTQITRNDIRYAVNLLSSSTVNVNYASLPQAEYVRTDVLLIGKYKGRRAIGLPFQNNIPILRSADIYLAMAEARAALGDLTSSSSVNSQIYAEGQVGSSVQSILYFLRVNRSSNRSLAVHVPISTTQSAWKAILDERRVEFAFEGHRYLDMKRLGVKAGAPGFVRFEKDCVVNNACLLPVTDHKMTFPIPSTELNSNSIIRGQQNPGY